MEDVVFLFAGRTHAANRTSDQHRHSDRYQDRGKIVADMRQMRQEGVHFGEPHTKLLRSIRMLKPLEGLLHPAHRGDIPYSLTSTDAKIYCFDHSACPFCGISISEKP